MAVTDPIKLTIYNGALRRLGSRQLASLSENREPRRVLDGIWGNSDEVVVWALERGEWNFAIRTVLSDYSPSIEPEFGFRRAFEKPEDFVRLAGLSANEYMSQPLTNEQYIEEATYWFSDHDVLYIRYVSSGDDYGMNSAAWSEAFKEMLEAKLAWEAAERITNSTAMGERIRRDYMDALKAAKSHDAMGEGVKFPPRGSWGSARVGGGRRERSRMGY